jgi:hypothetical protein
MDVGEAREGEIALLSFKLDFYQVVEREIEILPARYEIFGENPTTHPPF